MQQHGYGKIAVFKCGNAKMRTRIAVFEYGYRQNLTHSFHATPERGQNPNQVIEPCRLVVQRPNEMGLPLSPPAGATRLRHKSGKTLPWSTTAI